MNFDYQKYILPMRRRFQARGLTVRNRPRKNRLHPELEGLIGNEYQSAYMRLWRAGKTGAR